MNEPYKTPEEHQTQSRKSMQSMNWRLATFSGAGTLAGTIIYTGFETATYYFLHSNGLAPANYYDTYFLLFRVAYILLVASGGIVGTLIGLRWCRMKRTESD